MLQNAYFLAKIGADTAENERNFAENLPKIGNYPTGPGPCSRTANTVPFLPDAGAPPDLGAVLALWRLLPRPRRIAKAPMLGVRVSKISKIGKFCIFFAKFCKFLAGSFSAVSKRNFARRYAFDSIFQALQDLHTFAPLQSQNFSKKIYLKNQHFS